MAKTDIIFVDGLEKDAAKQLESQVKARVLGQYTATKQHQAKGETCSRLCRRGCPCLFLGAGSSSLCIAAARSFAYEINTLL